MVHHLISVRIADVLDELNKLERHLGELPRPQDVAQYQGSRVPTASAFTQALGAATQTASDATSKIIEELANTDSTIRVALKDLTAHHDELADSAERFENFLDSATVYATPPVTPSTTFTSGDTGGANYGDY